MAQAAHRAISRITQAAAPMCYLGIPTIPCHSLALYTLTFSLIHAYTCRHLLARWACGGPFGPRQFFYAASRSHRHISTERLARPERFACAM